MANSTQNYTRTFLVFSGRLTKGPLLCRKVTYEDIAMRFSLIDRITELKEGVSITAEMQLPPTADYLRDHFPGFPVMPGVLMLETMNQAAMWLVYASDKFENSIVHLKEAKNVKYQDFVKPGQVLVVQAEVVKEDENTTTLKATGTVDGKTAVGGRLVLEKFTLADRFPSVGSLDGYTRKQLREFLQGINQAN